MGLSIETGVPVFTVFLQGLLSFFSPCVLPLVPLYVGYLAGGTKSLGPDGQIRYKRSTVLLNTLFFVLGVSFAFFLLGFGFTALGKFFSGNRALFARIGGLIVILFGLYQLGFFGGKGLSREHRLPFRMDRFAMSPLVALVLGFTFSFAWTPCVGPALASVLLMASSAGSSLVGFGLVGVYTLGFVLPFLGVGLFTSSLLNFFKRHQKGLRYTVKVGGALMILMGVMMFTGWMNGITGYLSGIGAGGTEQNGASQSASSSTGDAGEGGASSGGSQSQGGSSQTSAFPAPDFTLVDQNGKTHTLSEYRGKVVFLNFWATWCGPCQREMPDVQALYEKYGENSGDVVVLGVANPKSAKYPRNQDVSREEVVSFLQKNGYDYPVVMDETGAVFNGYGVTAFPTTYMIDRDGNLFGYVPGMLTRSVMEQIVQQTLDGSSRS
ncbi:redoxin family protein [Bittarella massiliensis (ex Durand et al. 2017)]|uniref:redoxin family protein n=1 Tax=Bittarella massiliensis (ex Durand et al. 2017) TaxID=1720313 RepID=UPI00073F6646|nr:cytochrome c biogenesis protein CcdA [Bittarella massiliensis (ex Durand et al. 2017)]